MAAELRKAGWTVIPPLTASDGMMRSPNSVARQRLKVLDRPGAADWAPRRRHSELIRRLIAAGILREATGCAFVLA